MKPPLKAYLEGFVNLVFPPLGVVCTFLPNGLITN